MLNVVYAQLDNVHYLQPIIFGAYNDGTITNEYVYLSTPSATDITIKVTLADGVTIPIISVYDINSGVAPNVVTDGKVTINNTKSKRIALSNAAGSIYGPGSANSRLTLATNRAGTIIPANIGGLIFTSNFNSNFFVNYRGRSEPQAGSVLTKGMAALGKHFFWGGTPTENITPIPEVGNMASIMATEDNTTITISNIDAGTQFINGTSSILLTGPTLTRMLQKGESFILYAKVRVNTLSIQDTGWLGARINADKNIAVTVGGLMQQGGGTTASLDTRDIGVDQLIPVEQLGTEYVVMQGNGGSLERVVVVATEANTTINVNSNTGAPDYMLTNAGDYAVIPASLFVNKNMYLKTSKSVYVFHKIYGSASGATNSMMFIPPLSCFGQKEVNVIPAAQTIGAEHYLNTELAVLAASGTVPTVTVSGTPALTIASAGGAAGMAVPGNPNWRSYRYNISGTSSGGAIKNVRIISTGTIQAELIGANEGAGFGGYYSGFGTAPVAVIIVSNSPNPLRPCTGNTGNSILSVDSGMGTYQWYKNNIAIPGATTNTYAVPLTDIVAAEYSVIATAPGSCLIYSNVVKSYACPCYKPGATGTPEITKIGISTRDSKSTANFPADINNGFIALESNDKGMVITRIPEPEISIPSPVNGMMVYDTDDNCLKIYDGTQWSCINQTCN